MQKEITKKLLDKVVEDYNNISEDFDRTRQKDWQEFNHFLKYIKPQSKIADLGCGNGRLLKFLNENSQVDYIGIDNSSNLLEKAKKNHPEQKFIQGDLLNLPLETNSIDLVTAIASFHHIPSNKLRHKALKEISRILKKDGILIMTNWNLFQKKYKKYVWRARLRHLTTFGKYDWRDTFIPWANTGIQRYYYAFKPNELRKLLTDEKFEIISESIARNITHICRKIT